MIFAILKDFEVISTVEITDEAQIQELMTTVEILRDITDLVPQPAKGWFLSPNGTTFLPPVSADAAEMVCLNVYDPMASKFLKIKRRFIGENILWGINALGKTRAVGDFMDPIEKWFNRVAPLETITEIEIAKAKLAADADLAANLAPFVTISRLNWYKSEVLKAIPS